MFASSRVDSVYLVSTSSTSSGVAEMTAKRGVFFFVAAVVFR